MQSSTIKQLYAYWDRMRNGRVAPNRFDIEPVAIAPLLPETFIAECTGPSRYRFRLAGTAICSQFGRELRGTDLIDLWDENSRETAEELLAAVFGKAAIAHAMTEARTNQGRICHLEFLLMPLTYGGKAVNRALGALEAREKPFWLGTDPILPLKIQELTVYWPDDEVAPLRNQLQPSVDIKSIDPAGPTRLHVYEGGLSNLD